MAFWAPPYGVSEPSRVDLQFARVGGRYILKLWPNLEIGHLVGTKGALLARRARGEDLEDCVLDRSLKIMGKNEVRFVVVP